MILLQLQNIEKSYGENTVLRGISLQLRRGERAGLVGSNGTGKSTILKIITGAERADAGQVHLSRDIKVGYLSQKPEYSGDGVLREYLERGMGELIAMQSELVSLEKEMAAAARQGHGDDSPRLAPLLERYGRLSHLFEERDGYNMEHRLQTVARGMGFSDGELSRPLSSFSGGEKTRAQLAALILQEPELLLLDEPTNNLDGATVEWLENVLAAWRGALLVVSHDRYFLDRVATSVVWLDRGVTRTYKGNYTEYQAKRRQEDETALKAYNKQQAIVAKERSFILNATADERTKKQARSRQKRLDKMTTTEVRTVGGHLKMKLGFAGRSGNKVLVLENVSKLYGEQEVFRDVGLELNWGERVAVVGPNGAGKTTLLRVITGEEVPSSGRVTLGANVQIVYFDQEQRQLDLNITPLQVIMDGGKMDVPEARNYLGSYLFRGDDVFKKISTLSGGEISRLALAKAGLVSGNFLIMDEPTNHLDIQGVEELEMTLANYPGTLLVVSHDRYFISKTAESILEVSEGRVRLFPTGYADYREWKEKEEAPGAGVEAAVNFKKAGLLPAGVSPLSGRGTAVSKTDEKAARREQQEKAKAERLEMLEQRRRQRAVQQRLENLEKEIEQEEAKVARLEEQFADPATYNSNYDMRSMAEDLKNARNNIESLYDAWEKEAALLEELES